MNPSRLQNEEKKHEWTIVYDRAVPPAHSVTFAALERKPQPECGIRRGVSRTLTPPACRWVEQQCTSMENASGPPQTEPPVHNSTTIQKEVIISELAAVNQLSCIPKTTTSERTNNDADPRLPQRLPAGSILSPLKKSTTPHESETH